MNTEYRKVRNVNKNKVKESCILTEGEYKGFFVKSASDIRPCIDMFAAKKAGVIETLKEAQLATFDDTHLQKFAFRLGENHDGTVFELAEDAEESAKLREAADQERRRKASKIRQQLEADERAHGEEGYVDRRGKPITY